MNAGPAERFVVDALYLALAQDLQVPLITADRKFYEQTRQLPNIIWIGDYGSTRP